MYKGKPVLITGGLGFIGSNLAIRLVELGALVTVVDSSIRGCGANLYNVEPVKDRIRLIPADISKARGFHDALKQSEIIFNLAGEISHTESMRHPERDLRINTLAQMRFLLACSAARRNTRIVFASTRQLYGRPQYLPVDESHPLLAADFNGVHKMAACQYHLMLSGVGQIDAVVLRLSNVYGPRMALNAPHQGFLGAFVRSALVNRPLTVFGDGSSLRDPIYVGDAVEAFLLAGTAASPRSRIFNVGGPDALRVCDIAETITSAAGLGPVSYRPFPPHRQAIDIGSYVASTDRIRRELGWTPRTRFGEGVGQTLEYFRANVDHYLAPTASETNRLVRQHSAST